MTFISESDCIFSFYKKTVACSWWYTYSPCHANLTAIGYARIAGLPLQIFINYRKKSFVAQTAICEAFHLEVRKGLRNHAVNKLHFLERLMVLIFVRTYNEVW